jgi:acyl-CoA synthetase (AMP-forming)/AMP-acid ligase II
MGRTDGGPVETIADLLATAADDRPALTDPAGTVLTYAQLRDQIAAVAAQLTGLGAQRGTRVAIAMANGIDIVVTFLAVTSIGAAAAPLNPAFSTGEMKGEMTDLAVTIALYDEQTREHVTTAAGELGLTARAVRRIGGTVSIDGAGTGGVVGSATPDDVALLLHTSGTTSKPKTVPIAQRNIAASVRTIAATYGLGPDDIGYVVMPLFHIHGLVAGVLSPLSVGGMVVVPPKFSGSSFWPELRAHRATWFTAVPTIHHIVLSTLDPVRDKEHALRFARSCSSTLPAPLWRRFEDMVGVPLVEAYGMTEASHQMTANPLPPGRREPGSVGLATGVEVAILDGDWKPVPTGASGEVCVRGPSVVDGYLDNPEANASSFRDGWFRTGDVGTLDEDGYLRLVGRIKELINRGGEKISPYEVEAVLLDHPAVSEAAVYPVPDEMYGEQVAAVVVPNGAVDGDELVRHCAERLVGFKVPVRVAVLDAIPKGPTGKIQRRLLSSLVQQ